MVNVGLVGLGYWGNNLARNFNSLKNARLTKICDVDAERVERFGQMYPQAGRTTDIAEVVNSPDIDAVVVALPSEMHELVGLQALEAGKHVLVEKPMATSAAGVKRMMAAEEESGNTLMVDHTFLYHNGINMLKDLVQSGEVGDVHYIRAEWHNLGLLQPATNVNWDLNVHILSALEHILGQQPTSVKAAGDAYVRPERELEEHVNATVIYEGGTTAHISSSWLEPRKARQITIVGSRKQVVFNLVDEEEPVKIYNKGVDIEKVGVESRINYRQGDISAPLVQKSEPLRAMAGEFIAAIEEGRAPLTDSAGAYRVVKTLEAIDKSMRTDEKVLI